MDYILGCDGLYFDFFIYSITLISEKSRNMVYSDCCFIEKGFYSSVNLAVNRINQCIMFQCVPLYRILTEYKNMKGN